MMNISRIKFFLIAIFGFAVVMPAISQISVAANVDTVLSGGAWEANKKSGRYRVIIVNEGFEQVTSRTFVQWIADPSNRNDEQTIVASLEHKPFGDTPVSYSAKIKFLSKGKLQIIYSGVVPFEPYAKMRSVAIAGNPDQIKISNNFNSKNIK